MLPTEEKLPRMPLSEIEHHLRGCSPGSDKWNIVWPIYQSKRRRAENKRTVVYFSISTTIALVALIRSFFPAPPKPDYPPPISPTLAQDPFSLFESNPPLQSCLIIRP